MADAVQKITIIADDKTAAAIASAIRNSQKLDNQLKKTGDAMRNTTRAGRAQLGQLGHQIQDISVQFQMGMNPLMILGQQGSQIASIFGAGGAVVGSFIAVAAVIGQQFVPALFKANKEMSELVDNMVKAAGGLDKLSDSERVVATEDLGKRIDDQRAKIRGYDLDIQHHQKVIADNQALIATGKTDIVKETKAINDATAAIKASTVQRLEAKRVLEDLQSQLATATNKTARFREEIYTFNSALGELSSQFKGLSDAVKADTLEKALSTAFSAGAIALDQYADGLAKIEIMRARAMTAAGPQPDKNRYTLAPAIPAPAVIPEVDPALVAYNKRMSEFADNVRNSVKPAMQKFKEEQIRVNTAVKEFGLDSAVAQKYLDQLKISLGLTKEKVDQLASSFEANREMAMLSLKDIEDNGIRSLEDSLVNLVNGTKSVKEAFSDMARSIINDLIRMQIQKSIVQPLFSFLNPAPVFDLNNGTITPVQERALGGPVSANRPYLVGERGPELIVPRSSGTVIPNDELSSGGGVNITMNITTGVSQTVRAEIANLLPQITAATKAAVADARQRGGGYSKSLVGA